MSLGYALFYNSIIILINILITFANRALVHLRNGNKGQNINQMYQMNDISQDARFL
jgi:hypothetical protein